VVFDGSDVRDQDKNIALFQELSSSPATMEAGKAADAYGMLPGHTIQQADAVQAYTQATLKGTKTYVSLPKEAWPDWWHDLPYDDPVCELRLALYGHPDSGGFWEKHCDDILVDIGFEKIDSWGSCYFHPVHRTFLIVYVDDFKMAGPVESLRKCWDLIQTPVPGKESLKIEPPEPVNRFLGCQHRLSTKSITWHGGDPTDLDPTIQQRIDEKRQRKAAIREAKEAARKEAQAACVGLRPLAMRPVLPTDLATRRLLRGECFAPPPESPFCLPARATWTPLRCKRRPTPLAPPPAP
jgi:hypothetical protein